jgi:hypothetical protein
LWNLGFDRRRGKSVADQNLKIWFGGTTVINFRTRGRVEAAAQVRAYEVFVFARGLRADFEEIPSGDEILAEIGAEIEFGADGIAGGSVGLAQV